MRREILIINEHFSRAIECYKAIFHKSEDKIHYRNSIKNYYKEWGQKLIQNQYPGDLFSNSIEESIGEGILLSADLNELKPIINQVNDIR